MTALQGLLAKVEAGDGFSIDDAGDVFDDVKRIFLALNAYNGSLDAAKALHEAVLPGWDWSIEDNIEAEVVRVGPAREKFTPIITGQCFENNPARAWLICILKALIAQEATA